jgi:hypothetical protein
MGFTPDAHQAIFSNATKAQLAELAVPSTRRGSATGTSLSRRGAVRGGKTGGTGVSCDDIFDPGGHLAPEAYKVEHPLEGLSFCSECGNEIELVEVDGIWHKRDKDGLPHTLTCGENPDETGVGP